MLVVVGVENYQHQMTSAADDISSFQGSDQISEHRSTSVTDDEIVSADGCCINPNRATSVTDAEAAR